MIFNSFIWKHMLSLETLINTTIEWNNNWNNYRTILQYGLTNEQRMRICFNPLIVFSLFFEAWYID